MYLYMYQMDVLMMHLRVYVHRPAHGDLGQMADSNY